MLAQLQGTAAKDRVWHLVRQRTGKPLPHVVPLAPDGKR